MCCWDQHIVSAVSADTHGVRVCVNTSWRSNTTTYVLGIRVLTLSFGRNKYSMNMLSFLYYSSFPFLLFLGDIFQIVFLSILSSLSLVDPQTCHKNTIMRQTLRVHRELSQKPDWYGKQHICLKVCMWKVIAVKKFPGHHLTLPWKAFCSSVNKESPVLSLCWEGGKETNIAARSLNHK